VSYAPKRQPHRRENPLVFRVRALVGALADAGLVRIQPPRGGWFMRGDDGRIYMLTPTR